MLRLFYDLGFIVRNWRYYHAHGALWSVLKAWWQDYDDLDSEPQCDDCWNTSGPHRVHPKGL